MPTLTVKNYKGGYSTNDSFTLEDNQFVEAQNVTYNTQSLLETAAGYQEFGAAVGAGDKAVTSIFFHKLDDGTRLLLATAGTSLYKYDDSAGTWSSIYTNFTEYDIRSVLSQFEAVGSWAAGDDGSDLATDNTRKQGANSLRFYTDSAGLSNLQATLTNSSLGPLDWTAYEDTGKLRMWFSLFTTTGITEIELRWGSDASNYWTKSVTSGFTTGFKFYEFDWATATETGTPDVTAISYCQIILKYDGTFPGHTPAGGPFNEDPFRVDLLAVYPTTNDASIYLSRMDFAVYKNVVYMVNGIDPYASYDPASDTFTLLGGPNGKQIEYQNDRVFISGDDLYPHRVYYTGALPSTAQDSEFANSIDVGADDTRSVNVLKNIGSTIVVGKNEKSYSLDVANTNARPIDATGGMYAYRAARSVGNGLVYQSLRGLETLSGKDGVASASAIETSVLSEPIEELIKTLSPLSRNISCGFYIKNTANYYFSFDADNNGTPETTVVYSAREDVRAFTKRNFPPIYDYTEYENADGEIIYLFASASGGQVYQFETGIVDDDIAIATMIKHKEWDFDSPESEKFYEEFTFIGDINEGGQINVSILVDDETVSTLAITDDYADLAVTSNPINTTAIGTETIGGGLSGVQVDLHPYKVKLPVYFRGNKVQVMYETDTDIATRYRPRRMQMKYAMEDPSVFSYNNLA